MKRLLFIHGWSEDKTIWAPILERLGAQEYSCLDLGYCGDEDMGLGKGEFTLVGHSLGFVYGLSQFSKQISSAISINGFYRFTANTRYPNAVHPLLLKRMSREFEKTPVAVLRDFRKRAGLPISSNDRDWDMLRLLSGLEDLRALDKSESEGGSKIPVLALASDDDPIVPAAMSMEQFNGDTLKWCETGGGHGLPLTRPDWCAEEIIRFLGKV